MKVYMTIIIGIVVMGIAMAAAADQVNLPLKWSQPPVETSPSTIPPTFWGWDEPSMEPFPMVADDWKCQDFMPVVGIHWWGSYPYSTSTVPPLSPDAFIIRFWTNVPVKPGDPNSFSHPGELLHEIRCDVYREEFVGYDYDPWMGAITDATFQYTQIFPEKEWFWQDPISVEPGIYWVSISALYLNPTADIVWGWKTRPWYFEDDAVRSTTFFPPGWEPIIGPDGASWDMAFELYTIPEPGFAIVGAFVISLMIRKRRT